jgi:hypothetical protein
MDLSRRSEQLLAALLAEHDQVTSLQAGRVLASQSPHAGDHDDAELTARGRAWCAYLRTAGKLDPGDAPDTWISAHQQ